MRDQDLIIMIRDNFGYNETNAQKECVFKRDYKNDASGKILTDSLDMVLEMMEGKLSSKEEYQYPWTYITTKGTKVTGYFHGYPNAEVKPATSFIDWFADLVKFWTEGKKGVFVSDKRDKPNEYALKLTYRFQIADPPPAGTLPLSRR